MTMPDKVVFIAITLKSDLNFIAKILRNNFTCKEEVSDSAPLSFEDTLPATNNVSKALDLFIETEKCPSCSFVFWRKEREDSVNDLIGFTFTLKNEKISFYLNTNLEVFFPCKAAYSNFSAINDDDSNEILSIYEASLIKFLANK